MYHLSPCAGIRAARLEDAPALLRIFRSSWRLAYTGVIPVQALEREIRSRDLRWWQRAAVRDRGLIILTVNGEVAGYASCGVARAGPSTSGEIYELYLAPVFQGLGLGEVLFEACRARIDNAGLKNLIVWALIGNERALDFYRGRGGRPSKRGCVRVGPVLLERMAFTW